MRSEEGTSDQLRTTQDVDFLQQPQHIIISESSRDGKDGSGNFHNRLAQQTYLALKLSLLGTDASAVPNRSLAVSSAHL